MSPFIYSGPAQVQVQDVHCLQLMDRQLDFSAYEVLGFNGRFTLIDYRLNSLRHIKPNQSNQQFLQQFNMPALVDAWYLGDEQIWVELYDTPEKKPEIMLWLAETTSDLIPVYEYIYQQSEAQSNGRRAFLALYYTNPKIIHPRRRNNWPIAVAAD